MGLFQLVGLPGTVQPPIGWQGPGARWGEGTGTRSVTLTHAHLEQILPA